MLTTWKFRIKDSGSAGHKLAAMAKSVNLVWNYAKETQIIALQRSLTKVITKTDGTTKIVPNYFSGYDLNSLVVGAAKELGLHSQTVQGVVEEYARRRKQFGKLLRWRGRKALGWIPFKALGIKVSFAEMRAWTALESRKKRARGRGLISYCGEIYEFWASRELPTDAVIKTGSFNQDAMGHWYVNLTFESFCMEYQCGETPVGIDPGVITMATLSTGIKFEGPKLRERYLSQVRNLERTRLHARRQQAKNQTFGPLPKKKRMTKLHARLSHARADYLHKASTKIVEAHKDIFIGDVPCRLMNRSRSMAGVSLDNGLGAFKTQVSYKAIRAGGLATEINERDSTRTCSVCLTVHPRIGLRVREWRCGACFSLNQRDLNAAINILRLGHEALTHPGNCKVTEA